MPHACYMFIIIRHNSRAAPVRHWLSLDCHPEGNIIGDNGCYVPPFKASRKRFSADTSVYAALLHMLPRRQNLRRPAQRIALEPVLSLEINFLQQNTQTYDQ